MDDRGINGCLIGLLALALAGLVVSFFIAPPTLIKPTPTPMPVLVINTPAPVPTSTPTATPSPTATLVEVVFPTVTPKPDMVMTEVALMVEQGDIVFIDATPAVQPTLYGTPFSLCSPHYAGMCVPGGLTRAYCYQMGMVDFTVIGEDLLGFDRDGDKRACEVDDDWTPF